jgi:transposase InsO family protein
VVPASAVAARPSGATDAGSGPDRLSRRKWITTTVRDRDARPAPDLVERDFVAPGPNRLWVADITYIPTWAGFLYLAVVLDAFSRRIVGWAMETHLRTELVLEALNMAKLSGKSGVSYTGPRMLRVLDSPNPTR